MAFDHKYSNTSRYNNNGRRSNNAAKEILPAAVPTDYVAAAEEVMKAIYSKITTSKIRNLLSLVSDIYNVENLRTEETLLPSSVSSLMMMRVRVLYETGRDSGTRTFVEQAKLLEYLKGIGNDRESLIRFANYMEALVAYHRYFGGPQN